MTTTIAPPAIRPTPAPPSTTLASATEPRHDEGFARWRRVHEGLAQAGRLAALCARLNNTATPSNTVLPHESNNEENH